LKTQPARVKLFIVRLLPRSLSTRTSSSDVFFPDQTPNSHSLSLRLHRINPSTSSNLPVRSLAFDAYLITARLFPCSPGLSGAPSSLAPDRELGKLKAYGFCEFAGTSHVSLSTRSRRADQTQVLRPPNRPKNYLRHQRSSCPCLSRAGGCRFSF